VLLFLTETRPALGPTHPPLQWVPGSLSPDVERPGRETYLHLLLSRLRMRGAVASWLLVKYGVNFTFSPTSKFLPSMRRSPRWSLSMKFSYPVLYFSAPHARRMTPRPFLLDYATVETSCWHAVCGSAARVTVATVLVG
jgi:hypothetical protein